MRSAYEHFKNKHDGTAKGQFKINQCKVTICDDKNKIYTLDPNDGIICGHCLRGKTGEQHLDTPI